MTDAGDDGAVFGIEAVSRHFDKVRDEDADVVVRLRAVGVAGDLTNLPVAQLFVNLPQLFVAFLLQARQLLDDAVGADIVRAAQLAISASTVSKSVSKSSRIFVMGR